MAKLRMSHARTHGARKPPGPKLSNRVENFRALKLSNRVSFRALKLSILATASVCPRLRANWLLKSHEYRRGLRGPGRMCSQPLWGERGMGGDRNQQDRAWLCEALHNSCFARSGWQGACITTLWLAISSIAPRLPNTPSHHAQRR